MTNMKKRIAAALTAVILTASLTVLTTAAETPDEPVRVSSYNGSALEVGERSGLIIGPSGTEYTVTSSDPDTVVIEQVLTFWVAVAKAEGSAEITASNRTGECGSMTLTISSTTPTTPRTPSDGDSTTLTDNMEVRQKMNGIRRESDKGRGG